jgi:hypothetical protein
MNRRRFGYTALASLAGWTALPVILSARQAHSAEMDRTIAFYSRTSTDKGLRFLREHQTRNGSWEGGVANTALALTSFLTSYQRYNPSDGPFITKPVSWLLDAVEGQGAATSVTMPHGDLALAIIALRAVDDPDNDGLILTAQQRLAVGEFALSDRDATAAQINTFLASNALRGSKAEGVADFRGRAFNQLTALQLPTGGFPGADGTESFAMTCASTVSLADAMQNSGEGVLMASLERVVETYSSDSALIAPDAPKFFFYDAVQAAMTTVERRMRPDEMGEAANWRDTLAYSLLQLQAEDGGWLPASPEADRVTATARAVGALNKALG